MVAVRGALEQGPRHPPVPLPDPVFWGGYPTSLGTGTRSCAEEHSFSKPQCLPGRHTPVFGDGLLLPWKHDPSASGSMLTVSQKLSTWAPRSSSAIPPSPSLKAFHPSWRPRGHTTWAGMWVALRKPANRSELHCFT